jgi:tRNA A37 threonylcarbamoyladenosine synthetase subunit TsaC/SUA5/YrdC
MRYTAKYENCRDVRAYVYPMNEALSLLDGAIGILPTDTLYGIVASVHVPRAVERVYTCKGRAPEKPCIILISSLDELVSFGISHNFLMSGILGTYYSSVR